jgi:hypothetical protein
MGLSWHSVPDLAEGDDLTEQLTAGRGLWSGGADTESAEPETAGWSHVEVQCIAPQKDRSGAGVWGL